MQRFNGNNSGPTFAVTGVAFSFGPEFLLGVIARTTTTAQRVLMGCSNDDDNYFKVCLNEDAAGAFKAKWVHVAFFAGGIAADVDFDATAMFDGGIHSLVIWRGSTDLLRVSLDSSLVLEDVDISVLSNKDIAVNRPFALGGFWNDNDIGSPAAVDVGEFWFRNGTISGFQFLNWMRLGVSARSFAESLDYYWSGFNSDDAEIGSDSLINTGTAVDHPIRAVTNLNHTGVDYGLVSGPRYEIYARDGSPADPAIDSPICVVPRAVNMPSLYGTLPASTTVFVSVYAANATGRAELASTFTIPTDASGLPLLVPAVPYDVQAVPLAGGKVKLSWRYTETSPVPGAIAATFQVIVTQLLNFGDEAELLLPISVPYQTGEYFDTTIEVLTGQRYLLAVRSVSALGATAGPSVGAMVTLDVSPPVVPALILGAA